MDSSVVCDCGGSTLRTSVKRGGVCCVGERVIWTKRFQLDGSWGSEVMAADMSNGWERAAGAGGPGRYTGEEAREEVFGHGVASGWVDRDSSRDFFCGGGGITAKVRMASVRPHGELCVIPGGS